MKILFVHDILGPLGGAEANLSQVASGFRDRGDEVALLFGEKTATESASSAAEPFDTVFSWRARGVEESLRAARDWAPDVIYVHRLSDLEVLEALVQSEIPAIRMVHDHHLFCQRGPRYFPWSRKVCTRKAGYGCALTCSVVRDPDSKSSLPFRLAWPGTKLREIELCKQFRRLIVQTDYMKSELTLHGFSTEQIRILPVIPEDDGFAEISSRSPENDDGPPLILFVGQVIRGKGVDFLLKALKRIEAKDWTCSIAGDGNHLEHCRRLCRRLGLDERVTFHGRLERGELAGLYHRARLGVVPSVWPEPMGMVGLEFMAQALPVVAFDVGGISDWLLDGETGFLARPLDISGLAAGICRLLTDPSLARKFGALGQERSRELYRFNDYLDHLRQLLLEETTSLFSDRMPQTLSAAAPV